MVWQGSAGELGFVALWLVLHGGAWYGRRGTFMQGTARLGLARFGEVWQSWAG